MMVGLDLPLLLQVRHTHTHALTHTHSHTTHCQLYRRSCVDRPLRCPAAHSRSCSQPSPVKPAFRCSGGTRSRPTSGLPSSLSSGTGGAQVPRRATGQLLPAYCCRSTAAGLLRPTYCCRPTHAMLTSPRWAFECARRLAAELRCTGEGTPTTSTPSSGRTTPCRLTMPTVSRSRFAAPTPLQRPAHGPRR